MASYRNLMDGCTDRQTSPITWNPLSAERVRKTTTSPADKRAHNTHVHVEVKISAMEPLQQTLLVLRRERCLLYKGFYYKVMIIVRYNAFSKQVSPIQRCPLYRGVCCEACLLQRGPTVLTDFRVSTEKYKSRVLKCSLTGKESCAQKIRALSFLVQTRKWVNITFIDIQTRRLQLRSSFSSVPHVIVKLFIGRKFCGYKLSRFCKLFGRSQKFIPAKSQCSGHSRKFFFSPSKTHSTFCRLNYHR